MAADPHGGARKVMERAIWRLNVLEYLMLGMAAALSLGGGALVAWILQTSFGVPFRPSWVIASLFLFIIPGLVVFGREWRRKPAADHTDNRVEESDVDVER
ncbi:hypothetical protein ACGF5M_01770 [Gemmatimonadota bacterium]